MEFCGTFPDTIPDPPGPQDAGDVCEVVNSQQSEYDDARVFTALSVVHPMVDADIMDSPVRTVTKSEHTDCSPKPVPREVIDVEDSPAKRVSADSPAGQRVTGDACGDASPLKCTSVEPLSSDAYGDVSPLKCASVEPLSSDAYGDVSPLKMPVLSVVGNTSAAASTCSDIGEMDAQEMLDDGEEFWDWCENDAEAFASQLQDFYAATGYVGDDIDNASMVPQVGDDLGERGPADVELLQTASGAADIISIKQLEKEHANVLRTSYTDRTAYMRFIRQSVSKKKPIPANLITRFQTDRQSLFADFVETDECWYTISLIETRRQTMTKEGSKKYRLMSQQDLYEKYKDLQIVNKIKESKIKAGLWSHDPNCPDLEECNLYYCLDVMTVEENHRYQIEQTLQGACTPDASAVAKMLGDGGHFADNQIPVRATMPSAFFNAAASTLQPGIEHSELMAASPARISQK